MVVQEEVIIMEDIISTLIPAAAIIPEVT